MFVFLLLLLPLVLPVAMSAADDPSAGVTRSKAEMRELECTRLREEAAHQLYPGEVDEPSPRAGFYTQKEAVICKERLMARGERRTREDAILGQLRATSDDIARAASAAPELEGALWLVDAFYPDPAVAAKLTFAAKTALVARGRRVADRVPLLAAGDILVLGGMRPSEAYPLACRRWLEEGALAPDEALLATVLLDSRETVLHAGVCNQGRWRWLR